LQHQHITPEFVLEYLCDGKSVANVASVAVEHEDRYIARMLLVGSDEEGAQRLAIGCGDEQLLIVGYGELGRSGDVGAGVRREGTGIYDFTAKVSQTQDGDCKDDVLLFEVEETTEQRGDTRGR